MPALLGVGVKEKMAPFHMTGLSLSLSLFLKIYLCYFFWLWSVFIASAGFSSFDEQGLLSVAVCGLLIAMASLAAEHGL